MFLTDGASTSGTASRPEFGKLEPENSDDSEFEEFEDFARRKFAEIDRQKFVDIDRQQSVKMTKILFKLGNEDESESFSEEDDSENDQARAPENSLAQQDLRPQPLQNESFETGSLDHFVVEDNESICSVVEDVEVKV